jgi:zinc transporter, ZIP family
LVDYLQLIGLGAIAGFTIFLGLPFAVLQNLDSRKKGFLNALSIGILLFLIVDVFSHAWDEAGSLAISALSGTRPVSDALLVLIALIGGLALGLIGLVFYESKYMGKPRSLKMEIAGVTGNDSSVRGSTIARQLQESRMVGQVDVYRLSMMIATGIGAHNFSEGLAIGQSYVAGSTGLALLLIIGFGAHNATEGFGIAGPLSGLRKKPSTRFLAVVGLIGGGPTFLGTIVGSLWTSVFAYTFFLSIAGGALVYVSMLMYSSERRQTSNQILMLGIFFGLCAGFLTDLIVRLGGA